VVLVRNEIKRIPKDENLKPHQCNDVDCLGRIGEVLHVDRVVDGRIGRLGEFDLLNIKVVDAHRGEIIARHFELRRARPGEAFEDLDAAITRALQSRRDESKPGAITLAVMPLTVDSGLGGPDAHLMTEILMSNLDALECRNVVGVTDLASLMGAGGTPRASSIPPQTAQHGFSVRTTEWPESLTDRVRSERSLRRRCGIG